MFQSALSCCEVVNCNNVEIQYTDTVPTVSVDKTSGFTLYVASSSKDVEVVTSNSNGMNICISSPDSDIVRIH